MVVWDLESRCAESAVLEGSLDGGQENPIVSNKSGSKQLNTIEFLSV